MPDQTQPKNTLTEHVLAEKLPWAPHATPSDREKECRSSDLQNSPFNTEKKGQKILKIPVHSGANPDGADASETAFGITKFATSKNTGDLSTSKPKEMKLWSYGGILNRGHWLLIAVGYRK